LGAKVEAQQATSKTETTAVTFILVIPSVSSRLSKKYILLNKGNLPRPGGPWRHCFNPSRKEALLTPCDVCILLTSEMIRGILVLAIALFSYKRYDTSNVVDFRDLIPLGCSCVFVLILVELLLCSSGDATVRRHSQQASVLTVF
jgi:hypothetical protein